MDYRVSDVEKAVSVLRRNGAELRSTTGRYVISPAEPPEDYPCFRGEHKVQLAAAHLFFGGSLVPTNRHHHPVAEYFDRIIEILGDLVIPTASV